MVHRRAHMTTRLHLAAKDVRSEFEAYAKRFDLLELRGMAAKDHRQAPTATTLRRWRKKVEPSFEFCVVTGPNLSRLKEGADYDTELATMLESAKLLEARVLLVATPSDVTPSRLWRDRLAKLVEKLPGDASTIVWEPTGLWELEDAAGFAKTLGITLCVDPSRDAIPAGDVAYGRLRALGASRSYSVSALERIAANIGERRDAYVVIETPAALKEAKTLRGLVRALKSKQKGGLGSIVRPRKPTLRIGDDEQEEE